MTSLNTTSLPPSQCLPCQGNMTSQTTPPSKNSTCTQKNSMDFEYKDEVGLKQIDPKQFSENLGDYNQKIYDKAKEILQQYFSTELNLLKHACIVFTGSDGRGEKINPMESPVELVLLVEDKSGSDFAAVAKKVNALIDKNPTLFFKKLEVKCLKLDHMSTYTRLDDTGTPIEERAFPTRALDATYLAGNASVFAKYKDLFFQELQQADMQKTLKGFADSALKPTISLLNKAAEHKDTSHLDIEKDALYSDGDRIKGTKYPLLRAVQYKLADHIVKVIKHKGLSKTDFLKMPRSTIDRIQWLADNKLIAISQAAVEATKQAYAAALYWFGRAQIALKEENKKEIILPKGELENISKRIHNFCNSKIIFGIGKAPNSKKSSSTENTESVTPAEDTAGMEEKN